MKWITEKPTEPGWYWFRCDGDIDTVIICSDAGPSRELTCKYHTRAFAILLEQVVGGEWWPEPIEPPEILPSYKDVRGILAPPEDT